VDELGEKLARRDELPRNLDVEVDSEYSRSRNGLGQQHGTHAGTLDQVVSENDELHDKIKAVLEEKAEVQNKFNKLDDVNLEKLRREESVEMGFLRKYRTASETELEFLTNAYQNSNHFSTEDEVRLRDHLRKTTIQIQNVTEQASSMQEELTQHRDFIKKVQDQADIEVNRATKDAEFWQIGYWSEAVPKVETMYAEIVKLNAELGRDIVPKEQTVRNQRVADRSALREACAQTLRGVDSNNFPAEYYEPGFVPGWMPATADAMRVLRPLGWVPVYKSGKVWLQPMYKPFTEEDAAARIQAQELKDEEEGRAQQTLGDIPLVLPHADRTVSGAGGIKQTMNAASPSHVPAPSGLPLAIKARRHAPAQAPPAKPSPAPLCTLDAVQPPPMYEPRFAKSWV
jgi:hypothetical protein